MTEPTDAEIDALWVGQQLTVPQLVQRRVIARAALAKWGSQPAVAGEPVAWMDDGRTGNGTHRVITSATKQAMPITIATAFSTPLYIRQQQPTQAQAGEGQPVARLDPWTGAKATTDYDAYGKHGIPLYTAPQPVERGPLTPEQVVDAFCKQPHTVQFVEAFIKGVRFAEQYHGIKGGQHGTE